MEGWLAGVYKSMATNTSWQKVLLILFTWMPVSGLCDARSQGKTIDLSVASSSELGAKGLKGKMRLDQVEIFYDRIVRYGVDLDANVEGTRRPASSEVLSIENGHLYLRSTEFLEVRGSDKRIKLFNGSIIVHFQEMPDLHAFALAYELEFKLDFSSINRGVFRLRNVAELENKLSELISDPNVIRVSLDTLDPDIKTK